jgi:hypothetical protein
MTAQIEITGRMEALALKPGDILVVHCREKLTYEQGAMLRHYVESRVPGHRALIMDGGLQLCLVRKEGEAP